MSHSFLTILRIIPRPPSKKFFYYSTKDIPCDLWALISMRAGMGETPNIRVLGASEVLEIFLKI